MKTTRYATDPVCGEGVDVNTGFNSKYEGTLYYFCSARHKQEFDKDPRAYAKRTSPGESGAGTAGRGGGSIHR